LLLLQSQSWFPSNSDLSSDNDEESVSEETHDLQSNDTTQRSLQVEPQDITQSYAIAATIDDVSEAASDLTSRQSSPVDTRALMLEIFGSDSEESSRQSAFSDGENVIDDVLDDEFGMTSRQPTSNELDETTDEDLSIGNHASTEPFQPSSVPPSTPSQCQSNVMGYELASSSLSPLLRCIIPSAVEEQVRAAQMAMKEHSILYIDWNNVLR
jgi:hypothetical protein